MIFLKKINCGGRTRGDENSQDAGILGYQGVGYQDIRVSGCRTSGKKVIRKS